MHDDEDDGGLFPLNPPPPKKPANPLTDPDAA